MGAENIFVNVNASTIAGSRCVGVGNFQQEPWRKFVISDLRNFNLYIVDGAGGYVDVSAYSSIRVGVGGINKRPTDGNWVFTHGGNDATFDHNASASVIETDLDAAPFSLGVSVTSPTAGVWIVKFDAVGTQTLPTTDASNLTPDSSASVKRLVTGDASTKEEWIIRLFQTPWAYSEDWTNITNGVTGELNFGTENLYSEMGSADSLAGYFEVELTDASSNINTVIQTAVTILGPVIGDGATGVANQNLSIPKETIIIAVTGNTSDLVAGTGLWTWEMPYAMTLEEVRASVTSSSPDGEVQVNITEGGSSIFSTIITIDSGETSSTTAVAPNVLSDTALADKGLMIIDVDQAGGATAAKGLKVYLTGQRA